MNSSASIRAWCGWVRQNSTSSDSPWSGAVENCVLSIFSVSISFMSVCVLFTGSGIHRNPARTEYGCMCLTNCKPV